jgi:alkylation response protein AidB-like acyl-CoA dehydrogenase
VSFWSEEQLALQRSARAFVAAEVVPHLQVWEDDGCVPRHLHARAAGLGFLGLGVEESMGGSGGTFLDALAVTEAFAEAGASSGLLAALFTSGIALPHDGSGYMHGTEVERDYRDARVLGIGGGATEVLNDLNARLLGFTP